MHIPDGFLDAKTCATLYVVSAGAVAWGLKDASRKMGERHIPMMGILSAFIFAAQMLNFPVAGGTSGHFMGGALAGILLGPLAGVLVMTIVLVIQCFIFQDGGLTALGANIFNMGIVGTFTGYYIYKLMTRMVKNINIGTFVAGLTSIVLAASFCALELSVSGTVPLKVALPAMAGIHTLIGIGEGAITAIVAGFLSRVRPDILALEKV